MTIDVTPSTENTPLLTVFMQQTVSRIPMIKKKRKKGKGLGALQKLRKILAALANTQPQINR